LIGIDSSAATSDLIFTDIRHRHQSGHGGYGDAADSVRRDWHLHRLPSWRARATSLVSKGSKRRSTAFHSLAPSSIKKQQDHPFVLIPRMLPRASIKPFSQNRADLGLLFRCRRIDFSDPAQAVSFGRMRARDEGSADFGRVPAGFHTEAKRFFCHNVTRREILHHGAFGWAVPSWQERAG